MCNFIMYPTKIGIYRKLKQIATKNATKKPNVRAHCVAEPDANQRGKFSSRPDTNQTLQKRLGTNLTATLKQLTEATVQILNMNFQVSSEFL